MAWLSLDMMVIWFIGFVVYLDFTIYLPTFLPYIQTVTSDDDAASTVYSIMMSCGALSQVLFSLSSGFLGNRLGIRNMFVVFEVIALAGTITYSLAAKHMLGSPWLIVAARVISGAEGGIVGLCMSYISKTTESQEARLRGISNFRAICIFAAIPASLIAMLLTIDPLEFKVFGWYEFNEMTSPSWFVAILQLLALLSIVFGIKGVSSTPSDEAPKVAGSSLYMSPGVAVLLTILFYNGFAVSTVAFIMPVVIIEQFGWTAAQYSPVVLGLSFAGVAGSFVAITLGNKALKFFEELTSPPGRQQLIVVPSIGMIGLFTFCACAGAVLLTGPTGLPEVLFITGILGTFMSYSVEMAVVSSVFSQIIPKRSLVAMMPMTTSLFAIGKIIGPVWSEMEINRVGKGLLFFTLMVSSLVVLLFAIIFSKQYQATSIEVVEEGKLTEADSDSSIAETGLFDEEYEYLRGQTRTDPLDAPVPPLPTESGINPSSSLTMDLSVAAWKQEGGEGGAEYGAVGQRSAASYYT